MRAFGQVRGIEVTGIVTGAPADKLIAFANDHGIGQPPNPMIPSTNGAIGTLNSFRSVLIRRTRFCS